MVIIGSVDPGGYRTKVCTPSGAHSFCSNIGEYRERRLNDSHGPDDMIWEYEGRRGFAGTLASDESRLKGARRGITKAHFHAKIRVLLAIHRYFPVADSYKIIVGQPIVKHTEKEKQKIKDMLIGPHTLTVDGVTKSLSIDQVEVAAEGASALLVIPAKGLTRIIDVGSGTINFATIKNGRFIDLDSFTERLGLEVIGDVNIEEVAQHIETITADHWDTDDQIFLAGGGASILLPYIKEYFPRCRTINPLFLNKVLGPEFANAVAYYKIGERIYGKKS